MVNEELFNKLHKSHIMCPRAFFPRLVLYLTDGIHGGNAELSQSQAR